MAAIIKALLEPLWDKLLRGTPRKEDPAPRPAGISLALGGGFARGFAHLGVIRVFEAEHIPINCIAGTSVGSILGAAYASGVSLNHIIDVCREVRLKDFSRWSFSKMGLASNERMGELIRKWFRALRFEQMRIPLAVVATDLGSGEPYVFRSGEVVEAVRASCAYPGMFQPVRRWVAAASSESTWASTTGTARRRRMFFKWLRGPSTPRRSITIGPGSASPIW